jgi:hypothetical protein
MPGTRLAGATSGKSRKALWRGSNSANDHFDLGAKWTDDMRPNALILGGRHRTLK